MKIMVTSFRRSHTGTATLSVPNPAAGHHQPTPPPETPGHPQASPGQSPVGSLLLSPGFWCTRFCCALQESISQSCVTSGGSMVWLMVTSSKRVMPYPSVLHPEPLPPGSPLLTRTPQETLKHSSVSVSLGSLGPSTHKVCLSPLHEPGGSGV